MAGQLGRIIKHLRGSVWLPNDDDYTRLAFTIVVTYWQPIFEAVPLLVVTGAPGTGKTRLGIAMTQLCANTPGTVVGQISAASVARLIDQTRGLPLTIWRASAAAAAAMLSLTSSCRP